MSTPEEIDRSRLQQRLRALLIVAALLAPTFCGFGLLALLLISNRPTWILWLLLALWMIVGALLGVVVSRILKTFQIINHTSDRS